MKNLVLANPILRSMIGLAALLTSAAYGKDAENDVIRWDFGIVTTSSIGTCTTNATIHGVRETPEGYLHTESVVLPQFTADGIPVTEISSSVNQKFANFRSFVSLVIPEGYKEIGPGAFSGCTNLESIVFPTSLERIEFGAFSNCPKITKLEFNSKVSFPRKFQGCDNLEEVSIVGFDVRFLGYNRTTLGTTIESSDDNRNIIKDFPHLQKITIHGKKEELHRLLDFLGNAGFYPIVTWIDSVSGEKTVVSSSEIQKDHSNWEQNKYHVIIFAVLAGIVALFFSVIGMRACGMLFGSDFDFNPIKHPILYIILFPFWVLAGLFAISQLKRLFR